MNKGKLLALTLSVVGCIIFAITINQMKSYGMGLGALDSLSLAVVSLTVIEKFGNASLLLQSFCLLIMVLLISKLKVSKVSLIISFVSIFALTRVINLFSYFNYEQSFTIVTIVSTFLLMNFGLYLIARSNLIIPPYDKLIVELASLLNFDIGIFRVIIDCSILFIVILLNALLSSEVPITIATLILTFGTGTNIAIYLKLEFLIKNKIER